MSDQDRYIPGVPCWVDTNQPDPEAAVAFYGGLFGWEFEDVTPPGAPVRYFLAWLRGGAVAGVASQPEETQRAVAWDTYVWVADADAAAAKVRTAGGGVLSEPVDIGDRDGRRCAPIRRAPPFACGRQGSTAAQRSSTSPGR
jgi:uncharacterized protein